MLDVIFNGSSTRKPSGMASVAMTFDNSDRKLDLDFDTVTVSRRLYRDGSSEYLLAHQPTIGQPAHGLDLTFGQVAGAVYRLCQEGVIAGEAHLQINPLAAAIARAQEDSGTGPRPETGGRVMGANQGKTVPADQASDPPMVGDLGVPGF